jgi:hypothetical protein
MEPTGTHRKWALLAVLRLGDRGEGDAIQDQGSAVSFLGQPQRPFVRGQGRVGLHQHPAQISTVMTVDSCHTDTTLRNSPLLPVSDASFAVQGSLAD